MRLNPNPNHAENARLGESEESAHHWQGNEKGNFKTVFLKNAAIRSITLTLDLFLFLSNRNP